MAGAGSIWDGVDRDEVARIVSVLLVTDEEDLKGFLHRFGGADGPIEPDRLRLARELLGLIGSTLTSSEEQPWERLLEAHRRMASPEVVEALSTPAEPPPWQLPEAPDADLDAIEAELAAPRAEVQAVAAEPDGVAGESASAEPEVRDPGEPEQAPSPAQSPEAPDLAAPPPPLARSVPPPMAPLPSGSAAGPPAPAPVALPPPRVPARPARPSGPAAAASSPPAPAPSPRAPAPSPVAAAETKPPLGETIGDDQIASPLVDDALPFAPADGASVSVPPPAALPAVEGHGGERAAAGPSPPLGETIADDELVSPLADDALPFASAGGAAARAAPAPKAQAAAAEAEPPAQGAAPAPSPPLGGTIGVDTVQSPFATGALPFAGGPDAARAADEAPPAAGPAPDRPVEAEPPPAGPVPAVEVATLPVAAEPSAVDPGATLASAGVLVAAVAPELSAPAPPPDPVEITLEQYCWLYAVRQEQPDRLEGALHEQGLDLVAYERIDAHYHRLIRSDPTARARFLQVGAYYREWLREQQGAS